jgi:phosphate transport system substrate-binding protein
VFAAPAIETVIQIGADAFNKLYPQANVNVYALDSRAIVDSLLQARTDAAYFDRQLSVAESLTVVANRRHIYSFLLGTTVSTWLVHPSNTVATIDSLQLLNILTGKFKSWSDLGGADEPIDIYLPPLDDGAWKTLADYYAGGLFSVAAHYWPNDSTVLAKVQEDPNALGLVGRQIAGADNPQLKKLKWINPILADPVPANIGSLQEGKYPFPVGLYYYTIADRTDLASGFLSFMASNAGQRLIADNGFLPAMIPVRIVNLSSTGDQK